MYGPQAAFIAEQFPTQVRYAGASLAYTLGGVFAGGIAPLAFQALYRAHGTPMVVALYATGALLVTCLVLWLSRKTRATATAVRRALSAKGLESWRGRCPLCARAPSACARTRAARS